SEVKALAASTAKATEEISAQIAEVQTATRQAVDNVAAITAIMGDIDSFTAAIAAAVSQQNVAANEIPGTSARPHRGRPWSHAASRERRRQPRTPTAPR